MRLNEAIEGKDIKAKKPIKRYVSLKYIDTGNKRYTGVEHAEEEYAKEVKTYSGKVTSKKRTKDGFFWVVEFNDREHAYAFKHELDDSTYAYTNFCNSKGNNGADEMVADVFKNHKSR